MLTGNIPTTKQHSFVLTTFIKKGTPLLITAGMLGLFMTSYVFIPKSYSIYQQALSLAKEDPQVIVQLGENIKDAVFNSTDIARGLAKFVISVSGTSGEGTLIVNGRRENNSWVLQQVTFISDHLPEAHRVYAKKRNFGHN